MARSDPSRPFGWDCRLAARNQDYFGFFCFRLKCFFKPFQQSM
jgi:hypothetical protein